MRRLAQRRVLKEKLRANSRGAFARQSGDRCGCRDYESFGDERDGALVAL